MVVWGGIMKKATTIVVLCLMLAILICGVIVPVGKYVKKALDNADSIQEVIVEKEVEKIVEVVKEIEIIKEVEKIVKEPVYIPVYVEQDILQVIPMGEFKITYYCACEICCGKKPTHPAYGITASGAKVRQGVTIAVDTSVIKLGTYVYIDGIGFRVAQDTGRLIKGNRIDVYLNDHDTALTAGVDYLDVYLLEEGD